MDLDFSGAITYWLHLQFLKLLRQINKTIWPYTPGVLFQSFPPEMERAPECISTLAFATWIILQKSNKKPKLSQVTHL